MIKIFNIPTLMKSDMDTGSILVDDITQLMARIWQGHEFEFGKTTKRLLLYIQCNLAALLKPYKVAEDSVHFNQ